MTTRILTSTAIISVASVIIGPHAQAQWAQFPDKLIPKTPAGEPELTAPAPRTAGGKPNLSGVWMVVGDPPPPGSLALELNLPAGDLAAPRHMVDITAGYEPDELRLLPPADALFRQRRERRGMDAPQSYCRPTGVPFINTVLLPFKIVQTPDLVLILYEENMVFRQVFLDGREVIEDPLSRWMGYSTGSWEGDTLVVETIGQTEESWLDEMGHPHSESMHVTERFRRLDTGHLQIEITVDDPETYSRPFTYMLNYTVYPDDDLLEYFCSDNEQSIQHYQAP